ncbi:MAG: M14 metallopeptidase family protein [Gemmatimonadales bacterium]
MFSAVSSVCVVAAVLAAAVPGRSVAQQHQIPTPESVLGFEVGSDFKLARYDESLGYFRKLAAASDRIQLVAVGRTSNGQAWYFALISTPENLAKVGRYREIAWRLAHPKDLTDDDARALAREGKAFVHIDGGLHASEVAGAQHTIQLAYDLVSGTDDPKIQEILDNDVVLLWPSLNPDGQNIVVDWYRSNLGTPYEVSGMPTLYQKYIGHDNNRDSYMLNMIESRVIARNWRHWEPQIIYVHHQTAPFPTRIWLPPFAEPIASQVPPLMSRTVNMIGMAIAQGLESNGQTGATHMGTGFDAWYPGYIDYMPMLQNAAAFWTETALYRYATPHFYTLGDFPRNTRDLRPETLYPSPWRGGWWRLKDAVDYMRTASMAVLEYAAKYRETLLYNRYQSGRNVIKRYQHEPPYAYFVSQDQRDPVAAVELLRRLAFAGVRVSQLTRAVMFAGIQYPAGTWVIPMDQEFAELARQVLDVQTYPDLREFPKGPPEQPYDAAGWTLPYQMDVRVTAAAEPLTAEVRSAMRELRGTPVDWRRSGDGEVGGSAFDSPPGVGFDTDSVAVAIVPPPGRMTGSGPDLVVDPAQNNSFRAINRALAAGGTVRFEPGAPGNDVVAGSSGRYVIGGVSEAVQRQMVKDLALSAVRASGRGGVPIKRRIGLYRPWRPSMDEGWTRWLFEQYGFEFTNLRNSDLWAGSLEDRFDVIILPAERPSTILNGYSKGSVPPRYAGGLGPAGVRALDRFVRSGGTLVCLNSSSDFAIQQLHLPVENVVDTLSRSEFFVSGSILEVTTDPAHPVMSGMPRRAKVFVDRSPVFTTLEGFKGSALAKYEKEGSPLLSGYLLGDAHLQGYAAALDVQRGRGHVVLLGFRPQWRGQPFGTFRVLFNAALYGSRLAAEGYGSPGFWTPPEQ